MPPLFAQSPESTDDLFGGVNDFFDSSTWMLIRNLTIFFVVVFWLATVYWVYKDARRRIEDPWMVAMATILGAVPPFLGPIIYLFFRPPEYLEDVRERELEIRAMEDRLAAVNLQCPVCRAAVESTYLVCPVCTTRLKQACESCGAPLEALWQVCPHCTSPVGPSLPALDEPLDTWSEPVRPRPAEPDEPDGAKPTPAKRRTRSSSTGSSSSAAQQQQPGPPPAGERRLTRVRLDSRPAWPWRPHSCSSSPTGSRAGSQGRSSAASSAVASSCAARGC